MRLYPKILLDALEGRLTAEAREQLISELREMSPLSALRVDEPGTYKLSGDGNIVGSHNVVNVNKSDAGTPPAVERRTLFGYQHTPPDPVSDFVGREQEVASIIEALRAGGGACISSISGMGGIGKTELALLVTKRLRRDYAHGQLFIDLRGTDASPRPPSYALETCIRTFLGLERELPEELSELAALYQSVLRGKRVLVVLDNAADTAQIQHMTPPEGCALLVTSRSTLSLPGLKRVVLDQLQTVDALKMLLNIAPSIPSGTAEYICQLSGYLPLAVRAAGSLLNVTPDLDPGEYAAQLLDERARLKHLGGDEINISVEASFNLSYARLTLETARVFRLLSTFPSSFNAQAVEVVCQDIGHSHLSALVRRSLANYDRATERYRLHDLIRLFSANHLTAEEGRDVARRHSEYYLELTDVAADCFARGGEALDRGLSMFDAEWSNIQAGQKWACEQADEDEAAALLCSCYPIIGAYLLELRQHPKARKGWLEAALKAVDRLNHPTLEAMILGNLGITCCDINEVNEAIRYFERAATIFRNAGNLSGEGAAIGNLGNAYAASGKPQRSIELYNQHLNIARRSSDRRGEGIALGNLGNAYADLGETVRAIEHYSLRLAIAEEIGDRRGESIGQKNMGTAHLDLYDTKKAIDLYRRSLESARRLGDRDQEANTLLDLSTAYEYRGDFGKAIKSAEAALQIFEQIEEIEPELFGEMRGRLARLRDKRGKSWWKFWKS